MKSRLTIAILLLMGSSLMGAELPGINSFKRSFFKSIMMDRGFSQVETGFEELEGEFVAGYGFINRDYYTDVVTFTNDLSRARFYIYDDASGTFKMVLETETFGTGSLISVKFGAPATPGGLNSVLLNLASGTGSTLQGFALSLNGSTYSLTPLTGYSLVLPPVSGKPQEPVALQFGSDKSIRSAWLYEDVNGRKVAHFDATAGRIVSANWSEFVDETCAGCLPVANVNGLTMPQNFFSAFSDLNGDCRADLVVQSSNKSGNFLEFYLYTDVGRFGLVKVVPIPTTFIAGAAVDINEDSLIDLAFLDSATRELVVFYNSFQSTQSVKNLNCLASSEISFSFPGFFESSNSNNRFAQKLFTEGTLATDESLRSFPTLRFGDLNLDGFDDLLITVTTNNRPDPVIFQSMPCSEEKAKELQVSLEFCRLFDAAGFPETAFKDLKNKNAYQSSFFDLGERGKIGLFQMEKDSAGKIRIAGYINHVETDFYFLKAIAFANQKEFFSLNGATLSIQRATESSNGHVFTRVQNTNCPFSKLCLPFAHYGLAKINNYVEYFQAGINLESDWNHYWSPVIPNSQLIVYADPDNSFEWKLNVFINPTSAMTVIFISTVAVLLVIGSIVIYMHFKEKKMDKKFRIEDMNLL